MIIPLFELPVYVHSGKIDEIFLIQDEIKKVFPEIKKDKFKKPEGWENDIQTNFNVRLNSIDYFNLKNLRKFIDNHVTEYVKITKPQINSPPKLKHSWINITNFNQSQEWHTHNDAFISGVYYYKTSDKDGNLIVRNPNPFIRSGFFPGGINYLEKFEIPPKIGKIILFPGWLEHRVEVNKTTEDRISIAFNYYTNIDDSLQFKEQNETPY